MFVTGGFSVPQMPVLPPPTGPMTPMQVKGGLGLSGLDCGCGCNGALGGCGQKSLSGLGAFDLSFLGGVGEFLQRPIVAGIPLWVLLAGGAVAWFAFGRKQQSEYSRAVSDAKREYREKVSDAKRKYKRRASGWMENPKSAKHKRTGKKRKSQR